ncbi:hypothetical protein GBSOP10_103135 [Armatimonadetes bacterium GBS]|jgi:hypothetical protein|nr:MAG: hypothetical protein KatS3mg021_1364 [Fimbriimonadales bacterium]CUU04104.1 hypothetical protein GBSOP10_103135 [Armatimonadetes bacterium GBS]CUU38442.1 hypothetical protein GXSOP10_13845 [Armatimonadetes bacterium GXS]
MRNMVLALCSLSFAFVVGQPTEGSRSDKKTPEDGRVPISQAITEIAQKFSVRIVVDPALTARVKPATAETLERALDEITAQVSGVVWRKVFTGKVLGQEVPDDQVLSATRALLNIQLTGLMVVDPRNGTLNSFVANYPAPPGFEQTLEQMQPPFSAKPIYVVLNPRPVPTGQNLRGSRAEQYQQLQQQLMDLLAKMSPEERRQAIQQGFYAWMNADPEIRNQMLFEGMRLSFEYWQSLSPDQQREMMEMGRRWFEQYFGGGGNP